MNAAIAVVLLMLAAGGGEASRPQQPASQLQGFELVDRVAATVERDVITITDVEWEAKIMFIEAEGPANLGSALASREYVTRILDFLVNQALVMQEMKKQGPSEFAFTEDEAKGELALFKAKFPSDVEYRQFLKSSGLKEETLRGFLVKNSIVERFLSRKLREGITISGDDVVEFCQKNSAVLPGIKCAPDSAQVREILIKKQLEGAAAQYLKELRGKYRTSILVDFN
jgi:hypothetical protein